MGIVKEIKEIVNNRRVSRDRATNNNMSNKFIEIMEIIYSFILAVAIANVTPILITEFQIQYIFPSIICGLVLVRFFFAPSKNIKIIGERGRKCKWLIMPFDVFILLVHALIYFRMCVYIKKNDIFYDSFFYPSIYKFFVVI